MKDRNLNLFSKATYEFRNKNVYGFINVNILPLQFSNVFARPALH